MVLICLSLLICCAMAVDFNADLGKVRPELHSSGFGPTICSQTAKDLADVKALLVVDYQGGPDLRLDLDVKGVAKCVRGTLLDNADDGMDFKPRWDAAKGRLSLFKRDFGAAVFHVEFE